MGFPETEFEDLAREVARLPGVTGVWLYPRFPEVTMWVLVKGFDAEAHGRRIEVRKQIENFLAMRIRDILDSGFSFDYQVLIDAPELDPPNIPAEAMQIAA